MTTLTEKPRVWQATCDELRHMADEDRHAADERVRDPDFARAYTNALQNLLKGKPIPFIRSVRGSLLYDYVTYENGIDMSEVKIEHKTGDVYRCVRDRKTNRMNKTRVANIVSDASITVWQRLDFKLGPAAQSMECGTWEQAEF